MRSSCSGHSLRERTSWSSDGEQHSRKSTDGIRIDEWPDSVDSAYS